MIGRAATSSSFKYQWSYDVFINFRGEDTRNGFTGNLYHALKQKGVHAFIDDEELKKGDEITPTLLKAIENSRMAIIVFSKNYASSTFCLNELVKIYQCIKGKDRLIWPIFYDVEPSEVRHQKGSYEQALTMHKKSFKADEKEIQSWKYALREVANISGSHFNPKHDYEYQFIERIVKEVSSKIERDPLYVAEYPVGLESRVQKITSLLEIRSDNKVNMVGICGIGGMGKTTIARAVYNLVADNFEGLCFLHDIKEKSRKFGLEYMQERILSKILGVDIKVEDVNEGVEIIKKRLKQKKVLLILDNVDKHEQLKKLAGDCNWFGPGSRIIITTRDKHLLARHGVERKYDIEAFNSKESLELLSWNAFRNDQVNPGHMKVLNCAIGYAQGLPLALEVLGSQLMGMNINEWESALDVYERIPNEDIQQVLKISYDDLKQEEKEIFLDIACFFKGKDLEYVKDMVKHAHDFDPSYGIRVLVDKCLIKIEGFSIEMHDLIQDMGRDIVRQESPKDPGKRSRLWFHQDIIHVLEENTGTNEVSIIIQDNLFKCIEVEWDGEAFKNMKNLKILIFENVKFSKSPKYLPNSLKVLKWSGYPSQCLPPHFYPKKLVVFDLPNSCLSSLEPAKKMENLSVLNLRGSQYITRIPNLSGVQHLKKLDLGCCENLIEIHDSVGYLAKLEILNVSSCAQLKSFPRGIKLPSLEKLDLSYCSSLKYFPEILDKMKITDLELYGTRIEKLPSSICNLTQLRGLFFHQYYKGQIQLPRSIFQLLKLEEIDVQSCGKWLSAYPKEAQEQTICPMRCPNRVSIWLENGHIPNEFLRSYLTQFINVSHLKLMRSNFTILPACIRECQYLSMLVLSECKYLREVEGLPPNIEHLEVTDCISLSPESKSLLLSKEVLGAKERQSCVPTRSIPVWFHHSSKGSIISFWYQYYFPPLCHCFLFKPKDDVLEFDDGSFGISATVHINDGQVHACEHWLEGNTINGEHLIAYNLESDLLDDIRMKHACGKWNHVRILAHCDYAIIEESGIYVANEHYMMGDIQFTNPHQRLDSINGDQVNNLHDGCKCISCNFPTEAMFNDLAVNNTSIPMLPWTKHACDTSNNQDVIWNNTIICPSTEVEGTNQFGINVKETDPILNKKRTLIEDDNFASSPIAFRCTKRGRNCSINQDDNDANTIEIQYANATETIGNQVALTFYAEEYERESNNSSKWVSSPFLDIDAWKNASLSGYTNEEANFIDLDVNNTLLPMLPWTECACDTFNNQGHSIEENNWHSMLPSWEMPLYNGSTSHQEFQQQQSVTSINIERNPEKYEDNRKTKGKDIVIYNDHINEK